MMPLMTLIRLITPFSLRHWLFDEAAYAIDITPLPLITPRHLITSIADRYAAAAYRHFDCQRHPLAMRAALIDADTLLLIQAMPV
jgi:hypothetical protein